MNEAITNYCAKFAEHVQPIFSLMGYTWHHGGTDFIPSEGQITVAAIHLIDTMRHNPALSQTATGRIVVKRLESGMSLALVVELEPIST